MEISDIRWIKHCALCKKRLPTQKQGTVCSIDNQKHTIEGSCPDFEFRKDIDDFTESLKAEMNNAEREHIQLRRSLWRWFFAGIFLITAGAFLWTMPWNHGAIHILPVSMLIVGAIILPQGAWEYFPHRIRLKQKRADIHEFLLLIKYYKSL